MPKLKYIIIFFSQFFMVFFSSTSIVVYVRENVKNYVALSEGETEKISTKNVIRWVARCWGWVVWGRFESNITASPLKNEAAAMRYRRLYILFLCFSFLLFLYSLLFCLHHQFFCYATTPYHFFFFLPILCVVKNSATIARQQQRHRMRGRELEI